MKRFVALLAIAVGPAGVADEGMWPPHQLPEIASKLEALGLRIDADKLSDLTAHPMNAVISLGGCTASFVSPDGLVVTNHHCAYGAIQYNSTEDRNLLESGFLAKQRADELFAGPGSRVLVTVEFRNVTAEVVGDLASELTDRERYQTIEEREKALVRACEQEPGFRCRVSAFHGGLEYFLIRQLEIRDVRLVYAPAGSVGKYGGDIDNWIWPRHTGDFSFYRAYVGPDGQPADHSSENVPYHPKHYLRLARSGLKEGDLVLVAGYPGGTNRYRLAREARERIEWQYPTMKSMFEELLQTIDRETAERPDAAIKYAGMVAGLNNVAKNYEGMLAGFAKSDIIERKAKLEAELQSWLAADPGRKQAYGAALDELHRLLDEQQLEREQRLFYGFMGRGSGLYGVATTLYRLSQEKQKPDAKREPGFQERDLTRIKERMVRLDRRFDAQVDRALWRHVIMRYAAIPANQHIAEFDAWFGIDGNTVSDAKLDAKLDAMYAGTTLADQATRLALMEAPPAQFESSDDPFIKLAVALYPGELEREEEQKAIGGRFLRLRPRQMEALIALLSSRGKAVYPDANGTLRVTYGTVRGYSPKDAMSYLPFTTLRGIVEKDTGEDPFNAPEKLLAAIRENDFGRYADERLGSVPVNFLSTVDTTGGNSGSPTLNAHGELVGLLFDGNYESINSDWDYNPVITRSIHVDLRYVLWIMEEIDEARALLREMGLDPGARALTDASCVPAR